MNDLASYLNNPWFILLIVWSIIWKGCALWIAARRSQKIWFVLLLIVNTAGLLEILYIYVFSKRKQVPSISDESVPPVSTTKR